MAVHYLKTLPEHFFDVQRGNKRFEIRKADRDFRTCDTLYLMEWDDTKEVYTGKAQKVTVTHILKGPLYGLEKDYCIMSLSND